MYVQEVILHVDMWCGPGCVHLVCRKQVEYDPTKPNVDILDK